MRYINNLNKFRNEEEKSEIDIFEESFIEILDNVFEKQKILSINYHYLIKRLWSSNKCNSNKIKIARFLLNRLNKESARILLNASLLASKICPHCNKDNQKANINQSELNKNKFYH